MPQLLARVFWRGNLRKSIFLVVGLGGMAALLAYPYILLTAGLGRQLVPNIGLAFQDFAETTLNDAYGLAMFNNEPFCLGNDLKARMQEFFADKRSCVVSSAEQIGGRCARFETATLERDSNLFGPTTVETLIFATPDDTVTLRDELAEVSFDEVVKLEPLEGGVAGALLANKQTSIRLCDGYGVLSVVQSFRLIMNASNSYYMGRAHAAN